VRHADPVNLPFPEPTRPVHTRAEVFIGYLDYFCSSVLARIEALPEADLRGAAHLGHLDIVVELINGAVGE